MSAGSPRSLRVVDALRSAAAATDTEFMESGQWFCADGECPTVIGSYIARRDASHMTVEYAEHLTDELESQLHLGARAE
jgi:hypothetical protein